MYIQINSKFNTCVIPVKYQVDVGAPMQIYCFKHMIDNLNVKYFNIIILYNVCLIRIKTAEEEKNS